MNFDQIITATAALATAIAAGLGLRAATVEVRNSIDDFIDDLRRQGRWAAWAAVANAIAAAALVAQTFVR